jgi:hypothetical protein
MVLPVMANSPIKDFTKLTFDKAIKAWVEQYSGHELSRRTIFRELEQRGLSAKK